MGVCVRTCRGSQTNPVHKISQRIICTALHCISCNLKCIVLQCVTNIHKISQRIIYTALQLLHSEMHSFALHFVQYTGCKFYCSSLHFMFAQFCATLHCVRYAPYQIDMYCT